MAIVHVQDSTIVSFIGTPGVAALSISPTAGNALVVFISQNSTTARTYTVVDDIDGATGWLEVITLGGRGGRIWKKANVPLGITTVTCTQSVGAAVGADAAVAEFSGCGTVITADAVDSLTESGTGDNHTCSAAGISSSNEVIAACACTTGSAVSSISAGSGYTEVPPATAQVLNWKQYQIFPAGCTSEVGAWVSVGTDRIGNAVIALLSGNAAAGRTTKNTRANPLGVEVGMGWRMEP